MNTFVRFVSNQSLDVLIAKIGPVCARNVAKLKMTVSNVLIGLDIVKPVVQFKEKHFKNKEKPCSYIRM